MSGLRRAILALSALSLWGCAYSVHLVHSSDYESPGPLKDQIVVESEASQSTFLGMVGQTDYVDEAFAELRGRCPGGKITGIQTRYSTDLGFFSWTNRVYMKAYCIR